MERKMFNAFSKSFLALLSALLLNTTVDFLSAGEASRNKSSPIRIRMIVKMRARTYATVTGCI